MLHNYFIFLQPDRVFQTGKKLLLGLDLQV